MNTATAVPRISVLTLLLALPALGQKPSAADADAILDRGREKALAYTASLPNFVCTEIIQRYKLNEPSVSLLARGGISRPSSPSWVPGDKLTVRLSFFQQKEDHKLELVNGQPTTLRYANLDIGLTGTGEFGGMLTHIFDTSAQASFHWESWKTARKHRVAVYRYTVAVEHSSYFLEHATSSGEVLRAVVGFHGTAEIDAETGDVLHFDYTADGIPTTVGITRSVTSVDFDRVDVGGNAYILPVRSETELEASKLTLRNVTEFRAFGKFDASSTVDFGAGK